MAHPAANKLADAPPVGPRTLAPQAFAAAQANQAETAGRKCAKAWRGGSIAAVRPFDNQTEGIEAQPGLGNRGTGMLELFPGECEFLGTHVIVQPLQVRESLPVGGQHRGRFGLRGVFQRTGRLPRPADL